jgi:hypothetical protein
LAAKWTAWKDFDLAEMMVEMLVDKKVEKRGKLLVEMKVWNLVE